MRQIEAGCHAIIVGGNFPENIGKEVRVVERDPIESILMREPVWNINSINELMKVRQDDETMEFKLSDNALALERNLMRIDGGDGDFKEEESKKLVFSNSLRSIIEKG